MQKLSVVILLSTIALVATTDATANVFAQGFGDYVAPQMDAAPGRAAAPTADASMPGAPSLGAGRTVANTPAQAQPARSNAAAPVAAQPAPTKVAQAAPAQAAPSQAEPTQNDDAKQTQQGRQIQGAYLGEGIRNAIAPPPENYKMTEADQEKLDEFLTRWEEFGKGVKRVSCDVHTREFDGVLQQNAKRPVAHTWGQFRFITPNKLSYHIRGEFEYTDANPKGEWKESQNEFKIVLDGKAFSQYDFKEKKVVVYPIADDEQDMDLTMDNGQFPLFFIAKAESLKSRFYMRIVTPESKVKNEVWLEAFPRFARDAQQFQSIVVILSLKDLQPTYMRKVGVNGKSKTDLTFENLSVNKGLWKIEGSVEPGWTKDVREEKFSLTRQQPVDEGVVMTTPEAINARTVASAANAKKANAANRAPNAATRQTRSAAAQPAAPSKGTKRY